MTTLNIRRVLVLPVAPEANTMYLVQGQNGLVEIVITGSTAEVVKKVIDQATVAQMITTALETALPEVGTAGAQGPVVTTDAQGRVVSSAELTAEHVAAAGKLSNNISGKADTATLADKATLADRATLADSATLADEASKTTAALTINGEAFDGSAAKSLELIPAAEKGAANGVATLDSTGLVPANQLPSFVDDVIEANTYEDLPGTGEKGKLYVLLGASAGGKSGDVLRWSGSIYVKVSDAASTSDEADTLATARDFSIIGDVTAEAQSFNGGADVVLTAVLPAVGTAGEQGPVVTTDAKGRVSSSRALTEDDMPVLTAVKVAAAAGVDIGNPEW